MRILFGDVKVNRKQKLIIIDYFKLYTYERVGDQLDGNSHATIFEELRTSTPGFTDLGFAGFISKQEVEEIIKKTVIFPGRKKCLQIKIENGIIPIKSYKDYLVHLLDSNNRYWIDIISK